MKLWLKIHNGKEESPEVITRVHIHQQVVCFLLIYHKAESKEIVVEDNDNKDARSSIGGMLYLKISYIRKKIK